MADAVFEMPDTPALASARKIVAAAAKPKGANERRLTDAMRVLLAADEPAARAAINVLLAQCEGAAPLEPPVRVFGEQDYQVRASLPGGRTRARRYDLLFVSGLRAIAVEVKLGASLADRQLEDLLRVSPEQLRLAPGTRVTVLVLGPRELELSRIKDRDGRLARRAAIRWSSVLEPLAAVKFEDPRAQQLWTDLFALYGRRRFAGAAARRPDPRSALESLSGPLKTHVQWTVGAAHEVTLDTDHSLHVTAGGRRAANIELVIQRRRLPRRRRRITIWLEVPRGGRRTATIADSDAPGRELSFTAPARIDRLESVLKRKLSQMLE